ncbi:MAG: tetratricopeptide repeat protein [Telmatospirillum sp.]|nr:tetratricopeptide repeat protein [Telmatospirillum sp.]
MLALAARPRRQPLVSDGPPVPPAFAGRLGCRCRRRRSRPLRPADPVADRFRRPDSRHRLPRRNGPRFQMTTEPPPFSEPVPSRLRRALQCHQAGRIDEAEGLYRGILAEQPLNPESLYLMGLIGLHRRDYAGAIHHLGKVLAVRPHHPDASTSLGIALRETGRLAEAEAAFRKTLVMRALDPQALFHLAVTLERGDRAPEAEKAYRDALAQKGDFIEALLGLGSLLVDLHRPAEAIPSFRAALSLSGGQPLAQYNLGIALRDLGRFEEAAQCFRAALAADPGFAEAKTNLGIALCELGSLTEAIAALDSALALRPGDARAFSNLGVVLARAGRLSEALAAHREAIARAPASFEVHLNLGLTLQAMDRPDMAASAFASALALRPAAPQVLDALARIRLDQGEPVTAETLAFRAIRVAPDFAAAWIGIAGIRLALSDEAFGVFASRQAVICCPNSADAWSTLGHALYRRGRFGEARTAVARGVALRPRLAAAHNNLGVVLQADGRVDEAVAAYGTALEIRADHPPARYNLGTALLQRGDWAQGWTDYEWRWKGGAPGLTPRTMAAPLWQGEALSGRTLLVHAEQGLGDTLQFVRFLAPLVGQGASVTLECPEPLMRLLSTLEVPVTLIAAGTPLPRTDFHLPLMSLPHRLGITLETLPPTGPYLSVPPAAREAWADRLASLTGPRIGLAWAGNSRIDDPAAHAIDRRRSVSLAQFIPLLRRDDISVVSLQSGVPALEREQLPDGSRLIDPMGEVRDFADTAALVERLDLVITVDTAVAHLAGAMAKPVWVLSRYDGCWRWLMNRDDSPWYPTLRLFRQRTPGDWTDVVGRILSALAVFTGERR